MYYIFFSIYIRDFHTTQSTASFLGKKITQYPPESLPSLHKQKTPPIATALLPPARFDCPQTPWNSVPT